MDETGDARRGPDPGSESLPPLRPRWSTILAVFVALLAAGIALGQLQGLLQGMHESGKPSVSIGGLNHVFHLGADPTTTSDAVKVWRDYKTATKGQHTAGPLEVAWWAVAVDTFLFAPLYALGIFFVLLRTRRQLDRWRTAGPPAEVAARLDQRGLVAGSEQPDLESGFGAYRRLATVGIVLIAIGFVLDELENVANIRIVEFGLSRDPPNFAGGRFHVLVWWLWIAGSFKWLFDLAAVGAMLVLLWIVFAETADATRKRWLFVWPRLHLLRLQLIVVAFVAVVPFAHEQIADLILRWAPGQLALTAALVWAFALLTWLIARRLLTGGQWKPDWGDDGRKQFGLSLFLSVLILAALQGYAEVASDGSYRPGWGLAIPAVLLTGILILGLLLPALPPRPAPGAEALDPGVPHPRLPRGLAALIVVAFGLGVLHASFGPSVYARSWTWQTWELVALALVLGGAALAWALHREPLVGGAIGAAAGLVLLRIADDGELAPSVLVCVALLFVVAGWRLYRALEADAIPLPAPRRLKKAVVPVLAVVLVAIYAGIVVRPFVLGPLSGVVGILLFFALVLTSVGALLIWANPAIPVPRALGALGMRRFPILSLLVVWFLAAGWLDPGGYHDVRLENAEAPAVRVTLDDAFDCWLGKNGLAQNSCTLPDQPPTERAVPLILVATTGGGIRAGYWTDLVLDCAFEVEPGKTCPTGEHLPGFGRSDRLFALSGVSGGSLGLTEYAAYLSEKRTRGVEPGWVERSLHADTLSASGAWWLFVEIPRAFLQFRSPTDRAGILERSWERQWKHGELGQGLLQLWRTDHHQPLLLLNGTSVEDGCRFETSPLDVDVKTATVKNASVKEVTGSVTGCKSTEPFDAAGGVAPQSVLPATRDLGDFLCGQDKDVRLSTAALLSARFPFVNPAARVPSQCPHPNGKPQVAYVVDGGYLDTSGASPIVELMTRLQPLVDGWNIEHKTDGTCIVPLMIQIDNGFAAGPPRSPRRPGELLIPLNTVFKTRGAREAEARVGAALLFGGSAVGAPDRYAHFVNEAHPGPKAPLGWTQSSVSEDELVSQLQRPSNKRAFEEVARWLRPGGLSCR